MDEEMTLENIQCLMEDINYYDCIYVSDENKMVTYRNYGSIFGRKIGCRISLISKMVVLLELLVAMKNGKLIAKFKRED